MSKIARFGVSMDDSLLKDFDGFIRKKGYPTRSKAVADIVRETLNKESLISGNTGAGVILLVYDHHKRDLGNRLTAIQHKFHHIVVCNQHIHLSHRDCMEIIVVQGKQADMQGLTDKLKAAKGVKHSSLTMAAAESLQK